VMVKAAMEWRRTGMRPSPRPSTQRRSISATRGGLRLRADVFLEKLVTRAGTSRFSYSVIDTAIWSICSNAIARFSDGIKR
jgi:hypothetical protein